MTAVRWLERSLVRGPYFTLCTTPDLLRRAVRRLTSDPADQPEFPGLGTDAVTTHFERDDDAPAAVVSIKPGSRTTPELAGVLAHEATHIWQKYRCYIGEKDPSPEFEAYAIQSITRRLFEEYERQITARRRKKK